MQTDWLIIGAGLTGSTLAERIASQRGERVVIVDQRDHIGGNVYDEYSKYGILTHKYGPHIFHTNNQNVFEYLAQFTVWQPYQHKVLGCVDGKLVPLPFNLNSIDALFTASMASRFMDKLINTYGFGARVPILKLRECDDQDLKFLAEYVYQNVFIKYTRKQWGLAPEELSPDVTARVPIILSRDDRYFQDEFQAMPSEGYSEMVRKMLSHPNIKIMLNTKWQEIRDQFTYKRLIFTGPVDEFFNFSYGELPYRSLRFDFKTYFKARYQQAAVINYPNEFLFTRITEQKMLTSQQSKATTILVEYPQPHVHGMTIPYYPVSTDKSNVLFQKYNDECRRFAGKIIFAGRLAEYKYYNMDQAVARALNIAGDVL